MLSVIIVLIVMQSMSPWRHIRANKNPTPLLQNPVPCFNGEGKIFTEEMILFKRRLKYANMKIWK